MYTIILFFSTFSNKYILFNLNFIHLITWDKTKGFDELHVCHITIIMLHGKGMISVWLWVTSIIHFHMAVHDYTWRDFFCLFVTRPRMWLPAALEIILTFGKHKYINKHKCINKAGKKSCLHKLARITGESNNVPIFSSSYVKKYMIICKSISWSINFLN